MQVSDKLDATRAEAFSPEEQDTIMQFLTNAAGLDLYEDNTVSSRDRRLHAMLGLKSPEERIPSSLSKAIRNISVGTITRYSNRTTTLSLPALVDVAFQVTGVPGGNRLSAFFQAFLSAEDSLEEALRRASPTLEGLEPLAGPLNKTLRQRIASIEALVEKLFVEITVLSRNFVNSQKQKGL